MVDPQKGVAIPSGQSHLGKPPRAMREADPLTEGDFGIPAHEMRP